MPITVITLSADGSTVATKVCQQPINALLTIQKAKNATIAFPDEAGSLTLPRLAARLTADPDWNARLKAWKSTDGDLTVYVIDAANTNQSLQAVPSTAAAASASSSSSSSSSSSASSGVSATALVASAAAEVVKVGTFCRSVANIGMDSLDYRLLMLTDAVEVVALSNAAVVLFPEYFFTKSSDALTSLSTTKETVHYDADEVTVLLRGLTALARRHPSKLIVCGTVLWNEAGTLKNTCFVCLGGSVERHDKAWATKEEDAYAIGHKLKRAPEGTMLPPFRFGPFTCLLEICLDNAAPASRSGPPIDLHLVTSWAGGDVTCKAGKGGWSVECDGAGAVKLRQGGVRAPPTLFRDEGERVLTLSVIPAS